jgi:membrane protein
MNRLVKFKQHAVDSCEKAAETGQTTGSRQVPRSPTTRLSIGPLIVIAIAIAGFVFGREAVTGQVALSIKDMLGDTGAKAVQAMLVDASRPKEGLLATSLGIGALLFAAIGVVVQLKDALNIVWEIKETTGSGLWYYIRSYVLSFAGVLSVGFCFWSRYL